MTTFVLYLLWTVGVNKLEHHVQTGSTGVLIKRAIFDQFGATFTLFLKTLSGQGKRS